MTNDIVDRLRAKWDFTSHYTVPDAVCVEAADEIERLRTELAETQIQCLYWREIALEHDA